LLTLLAVLYTDRCSSATQTGRAQDILAETKEAVTALQVVERAVWRDMWLGTSYGSIEVWDGDVRRVQFEQFDCHRTFTITFMLLVGQVH